MDAEATSTGEMISKPVSFGKSFRGGPFCKKGLPGPLPKNSHNFGPLSPGSANGVVWETRIS